jgi:NADPH:quinone reductase-like Zn-dependent oxidoreductase
MGMISTEAWVLDRGPSGGSGPGKLRKDTIAFPEITEEEVLVEPIYGCWEANMTHALERAPVDVGRLRKEERVVLGNAGVVHILETGAAVTSVRAGDLCLVCPIGVWDRYGFTLRVLGYDAPRTLGLLAKRIKLHERQVVRLPADTRYSLRQWAAFPIRYATAWSNWKVAYGCWRLQMSEDDVPTPHVWGWGGGSALAELLLARHHGCRVAMIASKDHRLRMIAELGIQPIDRRLFLDLDFDEEKYRADPDFKKAYLKAEHTFLDLVERHTDGQGVSIFIDNIGKPVFRATTRALGRMGVVTTAGWKKGMDLQTSRATECIGRHIHVFTHGARHSEGIPMVRFAEETGWLPPVDDTVYTWEDIPRLTDDYAEDRISSYFPIYQVNPL